MPIILVVSTMSDEVYKDKKKLWATMSNVLLRFSIMPIPGGGVVSVCHLSRRGWENMYNQVTKNKLSKKFGKG